MAPTFKNPLRGILSSVLPASVMNSLDTTPGSKAIPPVGPRLAIVIWVQMILSYLQGWTSESVAVWRVLIGYRLEKAYHCKCTSSQNEHEFVIYEFSDEQRDKLELRADRWVGKRKASVGTTSEVDSESDVSSMGSSYTCSREFSPYPSPYFSNRRPSLSVTSMKEGLTKISGSLKQAARRLSDSSIPRPSAISSGHCLASDTIVRINGHPKDCEVIKVLTFRDNRTCWPSLWDIMILIHAVHNDSTTYTLMERQCYWFADTMFGLLERWSTEHKNGTVTTEDRKKWWRLKRAQASTGSLGIVPVHHRDDEHMLELWNKYMSERQDMNSQREGFERRQTEIMRRAEISDELAREVVELQERERQLKEEVERERQLKEEQVERERQLKELLREEQVEKERLKEHLREEQSERERQLKEEQEQKEQQLRVQFEQQIQSWQMRLQQEQEMNERRFQELTNMIKLVRSNTHHHPNESAAAPSQPVRPQSRS